VTLAPGHLHRGGDTPGLLPGQVPGSSPAQSQPPQLRPEPTQPSQPQLPRLADGVELLGAYLDSGYRDPPSLVRRPDGQVIQMSPLLYAVARHIDGVRDSAAIAELVSADLGRTLSADQVRFLLAAKLLPLGLVAVEGVPAVAPRANPLLALRARCTLLPERVANAAGTLLRPLFRWPLVAAVLVSVLALDYWIFAGHGLGRGVHQVLRDPVDLLLVVALSVVSALFHECGHASGCRCGGARAGVIGFGIYLVWPAFFTNVTDSYRLSRRGRLRTDLGGLYFNLIFMLVLAGVYAATSYELLLLVIAVTHLEMLEQLLPFARYDGYFILSDLVGVPDLFARVVPILRSVLGRGPADPRVAGLRRRSRIVVTGWVLVVIPLLVAMLGYLMLCLPQINRALWHSVRQQAHQAATALAAHDVALAAAGIFGAFLVALSIAGSLFVVFGLARRLASTGLRWSAGHPGRRVTVAAIALAGLAGLAAWWTARGQFTGW
jgi:putative peptide zinc metalloprotease protein